MLLISIINRCTCNHHAGPFIEHAEPVEEQRAIGWRETAASPVIEDHEVGVHRAMGHLSLPAAALF